MILELGAALIFYGSRRVEGKFFCGLLNSLGTHLTETGLA